jgi:hypothetical protein
VTCHKKVTPNIVAVEKLSKHRMRAFQGTLGTSFITVLEMLPTTIKLLL